MLGHTSQSIQVDTLYKPTISLGLGIVDGTTKGITKQIC